MQTVYLESIKQHYYKKELEKKLQTASKYFPELEKTKVYIGILPKKANPYYDGIAMANCENNVVLFKVDVKPTNVTVFHELTHLALHKNARKPKSENYCSVSAMARMPPELVDEQQIPYIGLTGVPARAIPGLCKQAIKYREKGNHHYIKYLKQQAEKLARKKRS